MSPRRHTGGSGRAWRVHGLGEPSEVLVLDHDVPAPTPGPGEVSIEVRACALNFADTLLCRGTYQEHPPLPFSPGLEIAGTVVAAGEGVALTPGQRVGGSPQLPFGGLADRALARAADVFGLPDEYDDIAAASMHVTYQTGWFALHRRARLQAGETLLVHAGAGGVGSAAVQLGVAAGATVIATAGGPEKAVDCLSMGAHHVVDYRADDFVTVVNELTGGRGADVVFDPVGGDTFTRSTRCIAFEGRIVVIGAAGGAYAEARTNHAMVKTYGILGVNWGTYRTRRPDLVAQAHDEIAQLYQQGTINPLVSETLALDDDIPAALDRLAGRGTTGKLVVLP